MNVTEQQHLGADLGAQSTTVGGVLVRPDTPAYLVRQRALALQDALRGTRQASAAVAAASAGEPDRERVIELSTVHAALADALRALERLVR